MDDRTAMFLGATVFVVAVWLGSSFLIEAWTHTHPENRWAHALANIKNGTGGH